MPHAVDHRFSEWAGLTYPDILSSLQDLLSALADIDLAYECDLEFVRNSAANEDLKTVAIGNLQQLHHRRRAPIVRRLTALENRLRA